jgi:hypothetical protein
MVRELASLIPSLVAIGVGVIAVATAASIKVLQPVRVKATRGRGRR